MRKSLFSSIATHMLAKVPAIRHIDLWNEHVAAITGGTAWPLPALFIEFEPYQVHQRSRHVCQADVTVRLHLITRAAVAPAGATDARASAALAHFDLIDALHTAMATLNGSNFSTFQLLECQTDHSHAELIESVERYVTSAVDVVAGRKAPTQTEGFQLNVARG